jgi:hypothetical protein
MSPCDFHEFGLLKKALMGHRFGLDTDMKATVVQWFQQQTREFFAEGTISWCVNGMPASATMAIIFNDFYSFAQNNH